jgi:hypothetical protein
MQGTSVATITAKPLSRRAYLRVTKDLWPGDRRSKRSLQLASVMRTLAEEAGVPNDIRHAPLRRAAGLVLAAGAGAAPPGQA